MFTVLWKIDDSGRQEIYSAVSVSYMPNDKQTKECGGARHIAFQSKCVHSDGTLEMLRTVISSGKVFVMNENGQTVASYHFD